MTILEIINKSEEIDTLVTMQMTQSEEEIKPILDGIIDPEKYLQSKYKILWILKEPYDDDTEGGWDFKGMIKDKYSIFDFATGRTTFKPIIYSSWGILNNFCLFDDMEDIENSPEMLDAFKSIAYINIKKTPGGTTSNNKTIQCAYEMYKNLLLKQIDYIDADIIVGGNTLGHLLKDLNLENRMQFNKSFYYFRNNKLFIDTYHPAQRPSSTGVSPEEYCNDIINIAKIWATHK
jgi:hypothetical protein